MNRSPSELRSPGSETGNPAPPSIPGPEHAMGQVEPASGLLEEHPLLGRKIRGGPWAEQGVATYHKITEALGRDQWEHAAELARYFVTEAEVCYRLYRQWIGDLRAFLRNQGLTGAELASAEADIFALLALPDGTPWEATRVWGRFTSQVDLFVAASERRDSDEATALLGQFVETWRCCHDRDVDHISGLMNQVVQRYGEAAIGTMYDHILLPWFTTRYSQFDVSKHPWIEALTVNMMVAFEAMRGHLCGPGRRGDIIFEDLPDRYVLRFDPCGSGGRTTRGDDVEHTPPRMEGPYHWPETKEPAPWNHFKPGVCVYCAHCIVLTEIMPIDAFGYPVRAVDPPRYGETDSEGRPTKCAWTMFKDPAAVPEEYYTRIGRSRPPEIGSQACGGVPLPAGEYIKPAPPL
jgi:hypothetical protein